MLKDLIPHSHRRECWETIRSKQPIRFPGLGLDRNAYTLRLTAILIVYLMPLLLLPFERWILSATFSSLFAIIVYIFMNRYRSEIPRTYATVGDLVRSSVGSVIATKKTDLNTKELVLSELFPIVAEQFGVDRKKLHPQTRFFEDLGAG